MVVLGLRISQLLGTDEGGSEFVGWLRSLHLSANLGLSMRLQGPWLPLEGATLLLFGLEGLISGIWKFQFHAVVLY